MGARSPELHAFEDEFAWSLLDSVPDGVIIARTTGQIVFANEHAAALFGCGTEQLLAHSVDDLLPEELRGTHRAHRTRYRASPELRTMGAGLSLRARRLDGSEFHTEISLSPLPLGDEVFVVAGVRNIDERIAAEDHLRRVLLTLDASNDGVFMFDAETLRFTHVTEGAVRLVGYDRDELSGMTPMHINPDSTEAEYRELVARLLEYPDDPVQRDTRLLARNGVETPVEKTYRAAPPARDGSRWIIASARDISERVAAEAELERHREALREAEHTVVLAEDRDRIARDLHDTVIQRLFGTGLGLQSMMSTVEGPIKARLEQTIDDLDETIREVRSAIFSLQGGSRSAPGGLRGELTSLVSDMGNAAGIEARIRFDGPVESLDPRIVEHLVPTLREALSNVAKHARARHVRVVVTVGAEVIVTVTDDGVGLGDAAIGGRGLDNLATRAETLGGSVELVAGPDGGAQFRWRVPERSSAQRGEVGEGTAAITP